MFYNIYTALHKDLTAQSWPVENKLSHPPFMREIPTLKGEGGGGRFYLASRVIDKKDIYTKIALQMWVDLWSAFIFSSTASRKE